MRFVILFCFVLFPFFPASAGQTYEDTKAGAKCDLDRLSQLTCDYRIGKDLHIAIPGIGNVETAITIFKSDWDGDYYASFGLVHQCLVIKPGERAKDKFDLAFISPRNGRVYSNWRACQNDE